MGHPGYNFSTVLKKTVMAAVATLFAAIALSAQPNKDTNHKETPASHKNPPVVLSTPSQQNNGEADADKSSSDPPTPHAPFHDPNWVLVIVGTVTCCVIGWQSWEMFRQNRNMVAKERARIAIDFPSSALNLDDGPEWTEGMKVVYAGTQIVVANLGGTNAFNVTAMAEIIGTPDGGALGSHEVSVLGLPTVLRPNADPISVDVITLLKGINHIAAVKAGSEILHLVGTITYDDIFGNSYETRFRYLWEVDGMNVGGQNVDTSKWQRTAEGNRAI
jgi:hypothetical protein